MNFSIPSPEINREIQSLLFPVPHDGAAKTIRYKIPAVHGLHSKRNRAVRCIEHRQADRILN